MSAGASAGAAAGAAAAERMRREEEEMTGYTGKELSEDWEFKILHSNMGAFGKPEKLRAALDAEKRGGWILVEKFDNNRIRLKRPAGTKVVEGDFSDGYDPYRSQLGMSESKVVLVALGVGFGMMIAISLSIFLLRGGH